jgi:TPR repeat protein
MKNIGDLYEDGHGVSQDYEEAMKWFQKAADLGNAAAMYNIAILYEEGRGVKKDAQEAARWMESALRAGSEVARKQMRENAGAWSRSFRVALQKRLKKIGVYHGNFYGIFGPKTHKAIDAIFIE